MPQPGSGFAFWSDGRSINPKTVQILGPSNSVTATFTPLEPDQSALTMIPSGFGRLSASTMHNNAVSNATPVVVWALPDYGQDFVGWSGDASGTQNPLMFTMNSSKVVTANFTKRPWLTPLLCGGTASGDDLQLFLRGEGGTLYIIEATPSFAALPALTAWTPLITITNMLGTLQFNVPLVTGRTQRFNRAVAP